MKAEFKYFLRCAGEGTQGAIPDRRGVAGRGHAARADGARGARALENIFIELQSFESELLS